MSRDYVTALTDGALADRLRRITAEPRRWPKAERDAFVLEAARRLEGCRHKPFGSSTHCGEMSCPNYYGKHVEP